ncbi:MAG: hypothetical protein WA417_06435 [Stellaceae bacterium]
MKSQSVYPLRLPRSIKAEVQRRAKVDGTSVNQFVATAVAEKLAAMGTAEFFAERKNRADFAAFDRLMRRPGGEPPQPDDTIPDRSPAFLAITHYLDTRMRSRQEFYQPLMIKVLLATGGTASVMVIAEAFHQHDPAFSVEHYRDMLAKRRPRTVGYVLHKNGQVEWVDGGYRLSHDVSGLGAGEWQELTQRLDEEIAKPKSSYQGNLARQTQEP